MALENERRSAAAAEAAAVGRLVARRQEHFADARAGIGRFDRVCSLRGMPEKALRVPGVVSLPTVTVAASLELPRDRSAYRRTRAGAADRLVRAATARASRARARAARISGR